jgi:hypothetical protein
MPPEIPLEYVPFDMDCARCENEHRCFILLKICHKLFRVCRQGRKRKVIKQSTIQEALDRFERRKGAVAEE